MTATHSLFDGFLPYIPSTEGIKYAGSKLKLIPQIIELASKVDVKTVLDGFSGTTRVSQAFAKLGYNVICNDISVWSKIFGICYLLNDKSKYEYQCLIDYLNGLSPIDGWFTEHYGGYSNDGCSIQLDGLKKPWQLHNTRKLDAIRYEIDNLKLNEVDKSVALTSLILALDRVDNTVGHFSAYLKNWSSRSYKNLVLEVPEVFKSEGYNEVYQCDIFELLSKKRADLAYFDPPYGSNNNKMPASRVRYASYYHIWKSIILFDQPDLFGKASRRCDTSDNLCSSVFEEFRQNNENEFIVVDSISNLIKSVNSKFILFSYSSNGRCSLEKLNEIIRENGKIIEVVKINYKKNVMSNMRWTFDWVDADEHTNQEFIFLIEKRM